MLNSTLFSQITLFYFVFTLLSYHEANALKLSEALAQKKVAIDAKWKPGPEEGPLSLRLRNLSTQTLDIEVPAGSHFRCSDDLAQDMLAMKSYKFSITATKSLTKSLRVHCMEKHDYGPHQDAEFVYMGDANERLVTIAKMTASTDKYFNISQSLVWALADKEPVFQYSKGDSLAYWPLLSAITPYIKLEVYSSAGYENYNYVPIPRITYSSRVNMSSYIAPNTKLTLIGMDKDGKVLKEYYKNKPVAAGFYNVTIGYNEIVTDSTFAMAYKLTDDKGATLLEKKATNNTMEPEEKVYWLQTAWEMNIEQPIAKANLKLYGPDGKLLLVLYENRNLPAAIRKTPYAFYHTYGKQSKFKVRLSDEKGTVVKEVEIDGAKSEEKKVVMQKRTY